MCGYYIQFTNRVCFFYVGMVFGDGVRVHGREGIENILHLI